MIPFPVSIPRSSKRRTRLCTVLGVVCLLFLWWPSPPLPPSFRSEWSRERRLPQHQKSLAAPEGRHGRFVRFDTMKGTSFAHYLQTILLQQHVAFASNRSLAFEPWVKEDAWPFNIRNLPWRASRVPLAAMISLGTDVDMQGRPRPVSSKFYNSVCWNVKDIMLSPDVKLDRKLADLVSALDGSDGCVRVHGDIFDNEWFDSPAPIYDAEKLFLSPPIRHFSFAPAVFDVLNRALHRLAPSSAPYDLDRVVETRPWKHVLALDVRHGLNRSHECRAMSDRFAPFVGFAKLPRLPGNENVPPPKDMPEPSRHGLYAAKCVPDITAIIARARRMRKNHQTLRTIYVSTDAPPPWREELRRWLLSDGWDSVLIGCTDVWGGWGDRELGEAVDMEVARRAAVFVGNGFSSTGSIIALLRHKVHPDFTQFW